MVYKWYIATTFGDVKGGGGGGGGGCGIFNAGTHSICMLSCGPGHRQDVQEKDKDYSYSASSQSD